MKTPSEDELAYLIADATRVVVRGLFLDHPDESFYYCSLITTGEGHRPFLSAWSREALDRVVNALEDDPSSREELKWSYADSPFCGYGDETLATLDPLFDALMTADAERSVGYAVGARLRAMERAIGLLDKEGLFGVGRSRLNIVVNVEVMPPDHSNVERALRLNPKEALVEWLAEAAEF